MRTESVVLIVAAALMLTPHLAMAQIGDGPGINIPRQPRIEIPRRLPDLQLGDLTPINFSYDLPGGQSSEFVPEQIPEAVGQEMPETLPVYQVDPERTEEALSQVAADVTEYLEIEGEFRQHPDRPDLRAMQSGPWYVEFDGTNSLFIGDTERLWTWEPTPGEPLNPLSEDAAIERTLEQLATYTVTNQVDELMSVEGGPSVSAVDLQNMLVSASYDEAEVMLANEQGRPSGESQRLRGPVQVTIRPRIHGYPTVGPGGKLKVYYDQNNNFAGMLLQHGKLMRSGEQRVIPLEDVARRFVAGGAMADIKLKRPERIIVRDISLGYYMRGGLHEGAPNSRFAQPVYVFEGTAFGRDGEARWRAPYRQYLPAVQNQPQTLIPEGEQFDAGPREDGVVSPHDEDE